MTFNIDSLVRSAAVLIVGLPVSLSISNGLDVGAKVAALALEKDSFSLVSEDLRKDLVRPCFDFFLSKVDTKLEREAKNTIDEKMGGEVNYKALCEFIVG